MRNIFEAIHESMDMRSRLCSIDHLFAARKSTARRDPLFFPVGLEEDHNASMLQVVDGELFLGWSGREGNASPAHMMSELGIDELDSVCADEQLECLYLEFVYNMAKLVMAGEQRRIVSFDDSVISALLADVSDAASILGMEFRRLADGRYCLCVRDAAVLQASAAANDDDEAMLLVEYLRSVNVGNLERKREILRGLGQKFEARRAMLRANGCKPLTESIGNLANNFNVRHNNEAGKDAKQYYIEMDNGKLESLYDHLAGLYAEAILAERRIAKADEIAELQR